MAGWSEAIVEERQILDYLLAVDHPIGGDKAVFFTAVGYTRSEWTRLRDDLLDIARRGETVAEQETTFGFKYIVDGVVRSPAGRAVGVRTVWISDRPGDPRRLVTAYPS